MRTLLFTRPSNERILDGTKTMTARLWRAKPPKVGDFVSAQTGYARTTRFAVLKILNVWVWDGQKEYPKSDPIISYTLTEIAKHEGYSVWTEFYWSYYSLNEHNWDDPTRTHYFIEFEVVEKDN